MALGRAYLEEHGQLRRALITKQHSPLVQQILLLLLFLFVWFGFLETVSLCSSSSPGTCSVDHADWPQAHRDLSASWVLVLKMCSIMLDSVQQFLTTYILGGGGLCEAALILFFYVEMLVGQSF